MDVGEAIQIMTVYINEEVGDASDITQACFVICEEGDVELVNRIVKESTAIGRIKSRREIIDKKEPA